MLILLSLSWLLFRLRVSSFIIHFPFPFIAPCFQVVHYCCFVHILSPDIQFSASLLLSPPPSPHCLRSFSFRSPLPPFFFLFFSFSHYCRPILSSSPSCPSNSIDALEEGTTDFLSFIFVNEHSVKHSPSAYRTVVAGSVVAK